MREKEEREVVGSRGGGESSRARQKGFVHRLDQETTSYFFTNFPDDTKATELWKKFGRFARVREVYIPNKVDKQGRRFGFVKFREVEDAVDLLRSISNVWIGSFKLRVNLPKFNRKNVPTVKKGVTTMVGNFPQLRNDKPSNEVLVEEIPVTIERARSPVHLQPLIPEVV
ncbi:SC35 splicing factor [Trifolium repens]|jgi:RNA recognition motif-containing protein|nr:SC35 splicing factor [Trifolium repens]